MDGVKILVRTWMVALLALNQTVALAGSESEGLGTQTETDCRRGLESRRKGEVPSVHETIVPERRRSRPLSESRSGTFGKQPTMSRLGRKIVISIVVFLLVAGLKKLFGSSDKEKRQGKETRTSERADGELVRRKQVAGGPPPGGTCEEMKMPMAHKLLLALMWVEWVAAGLMLVLIVVCILLIVVELSSAGLDKTLGIRSLMLMTVFGALCLLLWVDLLVALGRGRNWARRSCIAFAVVNTILISVACSYLDLKRGAVFYGVKNIIGFASVVVLLTPPVRLWFKWRSERLVAWKCTLHGVLFWILIVVFGGMTGAGVVTLMSAFRSAAKDNPKIVFSLLKVRAKYGDDAETMCQIGDCYRDGRHGAEKDGAKAREWYEKAAERGSEDAAVKLKELEQNHE